MAVRALAPGHKVYAPTTAQTDYQIAAEFAGSDIVPFDPNGELPSVDSGLLIIPTRNPTTQQALAATTLQRIAEWAVGTDLTIIADETDTPATRYANTSITVRGTAQYGRPHAYAGRI